MTTPRFELTSQRQKVSRLPTEPPYSAICDYHTYMHTYRGDRLLVQYSNRLYFYDHIYTVARVRINRIRLPFLLVVSWRGKVDISPSPFAPENLVSRDGLGSPVPRQPAHLHTQAESGAYLRNSSRFPRRRLYICLNRRTPSG